MAHLHRHIHRNNFQSNNPFCIFKHISTQQPFSGDKKGLILPGSLHDSHSAIIHWAQENIFPSISFFLMQPNRIWVPSFRNQFDLTNDCKSDIRPSCNLRSSQHVRGWFDFSWGFHQISKKWRIYICHRTYLHDAHWAQENIFQSISSFLMQPNRIWVPSFRNQFDLTNDSKSDIRPSCNHQSSQHVRGEILFFLKLLHQNFQEIQEMMDLHRAYFYYKRLYSFISWSHQNQTNQIIFLNQKFLYWYQKMGRIWLLDRVCLGGETF